MTDLLRPIRKFARLSQAPAPAPAGRADLALFSYNPTTPTHPHPPRKGYFGHSLNSIELIATLQINLLMLASHNLVLVDSLAKVSCELGTAQPQLVLI